MTLIKTITPQGEERYRAYQLGKYNTFATAAAVNAGITPSATFNDKTVSDKDDAAFQVTIDRLLSVTPSDDYAIGTVGSANILYLSNVMNVGKKMKILMRTSAVTSLTNTIKANTTTGNVVGFNGSFCKVDYSTQLAAASAPVDPSLVKPVGFVFAGGTNVGGGVASTLGYHVQYASSAFAFGQGDATAGEGLGGLTPIIMKQGAPLNKVWKYGEKNVYSGLPSGASAPETGDPGDLYKEYLVVRSSKQYTDQNEPSLGKTMMGYNPTKDAVIVIVQQDNPADGGKALDFYRDVLFKAGCEYAVGMDGSDSSLLYDFKTKSLVVTPGTRKNNYLEVSVLLQI